MAAKINFLTRNFSKKHLKNFEELPTLKSYPLIGHTYLFLPKGPYKAERLTEAVLDISKKLGPIFKLNLGGTICISVDADDTEKLFRNEGVQPNRPPFPALCHFRKKAYNSTGVVPGNGPEWYKFRTGVNPLLKSNMVLNYFDKQHLVAKEFVDYLENHRNQSMIIEDLFEVLQRYTIEAISILCPGIRFNCSDGQKTNDILNASKNFMDGLYDTIKGPPLWKLFKTDGYKKLEDSHKVIHNIMHKHLLDLNEEFKTNPEKLKLEQPFMHSLFINEKLSLNDKIMLSMEVFFGGIDATATTIAFTLYYLAKFQNIQDLARLDANTKDLKYLRACVKETLRMSPTAGANSRFLVNDTPMCGYLIPKNTLIAAFSSVTSQDPNYFNNPAKYYPDRWLRENKENYHKFASLPFGYGARMCPGKRIAENEIVLLLKEILLRFRLFPECDRVGMVYRMNRVPDRSIDLRFESI